MRRMIFTLAALSLSGCATPVSPAQVAAMEESVTIADTIALNYTRLPSCPATTKLCSDPAIKASIKVYAQRARDAVKTLQRASASDAPAALAVAQAALSALQNATPIMKAN